MQVVCLGSQKIFMLDDGGDKIRMEHNINCCMLKLARIFDEREKSKLFLLISQLAIFFCLYISLITIEARDRSQ